MWIYNKDKSKWEVKSGSLSKSSFDTYKQELSSTRFYAKCLSGATYLPTNDLSDIYDTLKYKDKKNWFIPISSSQYSETPMPIDDATPIESDNSDLYYDKNLTDYNLTLKNKFTPNKLIKDSIDNYYYVDISTTEQIDITDSFLRGKIDGVRLLKGHKILVKDQKTKSSLDNSTDPDTFFVGNYTKLEQIGLTTEYEYYNEENGIYEFDGEFLIKVSEFDEYENAFRYSVVTKLGSNVGKQFHLSRLLNGYYPNESEPKEFLEHKNWMIRNKLDYNNICGRNYYESLKHSVQSIDIADISYSIPERTISVGEFGVILNTQSEFGDISNIIKNKFKVDLFSVTETKLFYWTCGQKGTLLRVNKHDFKIEKIKLPKIITSLNCVRFLTDKKGIVVGDFNTILITNDGGNIWEKIDVSKFSNFDYNKCIYYSPTKFFVVGENGVFIEFEKSISGFKAYKRRLSKFTERLEDEYLLVDDINDIISANIDWNLEFNGVDTNINDDFIFITTNDNNIIMYDINENFKDFKFLYLDFNDNYGDITNIVKGKSKEVEYEFMSHKFGSTLNDTEYSYTNKLFIEYTSLTNFKVGDMINIYDVSDSDIINDYTDIDTTTGLDFTILEKIPTLSGEKIVFNVTSTISTPITETTGKSKLIITPDEFYFSSDTGVHIFSFENFSKLDTTTGIYNMVGIKPLNTINPLVNNVVEIDNKYYNDLFNYDDVSSDEELILTGNESLLKSYDYDINTISLNDIIDSGFYDRNKSKMLFMNYDIASKLNFFRDNGEYRLPEPIIFDITSTISGINFLSNIEELNWIDYWKDSLQTFKYNTISGLDESTKVLFSTDFTLKGNTAYKKQILPGDISVDNIDILNLAPEIDFDDNRFYGTSTIIAPTSTKELFLYKYLMIVRVSDVYPIDISDVIEISCKGSDGNVIIETNLIVNRIETFGSDNYIYMYTEFNDNIIKSIKENGCDLTNLNKFENYTDLENKFNTHPISNAYSLELSGYYDHIDPVITTQLAEPTSPNDGDRYLIGLSSSDIPTSSITPSTNWTSITGGSIVEWNNSLLKWDSYIPEEGTSVVRTSPTPSTNYNYQNGQWVEVPFGGNATIKAKFNNKTAYYNLGTTIDTIDNSGSGLLNQATDSGLKHTAMDYTNVTDSIIPGSGDVKVRATSIIHSELTPTWSGNIGTIDDNAVYDPSDGSINPGNSITDIEFYIFIFRGDVSDLSTTDPSGEVVVNNDNIYLGDGTLTSNSGTRELSYYDGTTVTMSQSDSTTYTLSNFATDIKDDFESRNPGIGITVNPIAIARASTTLSVVKLEIYFEIFYLTDENTVINDVNQIDTITLNAIDYYSWLPQGPLNFDFRDNNTTNTRTELDGTTLLTWEPIGTSATTYTLTSRLLLQWVVYSKVNCTFYMYNGGGGYLHELNAGTGDFTFNHELLDSENAYYNDNNDYIYQLSDTYYNVTYTPFNPITNTLLTPIVLGNNGGSGNYEDSDITQDGKIVTLFSGHIETIDTANANTTNLVILSISYNTIKLFEDKIILKSDNEISLYDNQLNHIWTNTFTTPITNNNMDIDTSSNQIIITFYNSGLGSILLINIFDASTTIIPTGLSSIGNKVKYIKELDATYIYGEFFGIKGTINILKNGSFNGNVFIHNKQHVYSSLPNYLVEFNVITDMFYNEKNKTMYLISRTNGYFLPCQIKNDELYLMENDIKIIGHSDTNVIRNGINEIIFSECGGVDGSMWNFANDTQGGAGKMEINKFEVSSNITDPSIVKMKYTDCFVDFGYSPIYNIYDYLRNINSVLFTPDKEYLAMPVYKNIPLGSLTPSVGYIDTGISNNNKILLGTDLKFEWESVFIDTFVDVDIVAGTTKYEFDKISTFVNPAPSGTTPHAGNHKFIDGGNGFAYSAPSTSGVILKLNLSNDIITTFGSYPTTSGSLYEEEGVFSPTTGKIYFLPADDVSATDILVIDPTDDSQSLIPWSYEHVNPPCITPDGIMYAVGGYDGLENNIIRIDTNTEIITLVTPPSPLKISNLGIGHCIYSKTEYVYIIGASLTYDTIYKLNPVDDTITTITHTSNLLFNSSVLNLVENSNGIIYLFMFQFFFKIDTSDDSIVDISLPGGEQAMTGFILEDIIYFLSNDYAGNKFNQLYSMDTTNSDLVNNLHDGFNNGTTYIVTTSLNLIGNSAYGIGLGPGRPILKINFKNKNTYSTEKLLVMDKYYDESNDAYVIEFHKKIEFDGTDANILNGNGSLNIKSRRKLSQISDDLRILNNIHRTKKSKKITAGSEYFVYDNELTTKIKTNSYTNILLSDQVTKDNLTAVIYTDDTNELSMNILNLDEEINPVVNGIVESNGKVSIIFKDKHNLSEHDLISISYSGDSVLTADNGCFPNSSAYDPNFFGSHVISIISPNSILLDIPWDPSYSLNKFTVSFTKTDSFLDYTPIDLVDIGVDKKGKTAIELLPENSLFKDNKYELVDVDFNKFRYRLFDGLTINDLIVRYPWILEAEISNAAIGLVNDELTWYSGVWECGRWFEGNWMSGQWMSGDFYGGTWNAKKVIDKKINIEIADKKTIDDESIWHGGRWFDGTWNGGVWRTGRWYDGDFNSGKWLDGIWNDGTFNNGNWNGGIWVLGTWNNGVFNTDNKPSYWIDGIFNGGDFGNGIWYNGTFESKKSTARFGTESFNSRPSIWHGGNFVSGSFHSFLDKDDNDNIVRSKIHKYSIWNTGNFISGDFYGGVAYNIDFNGTWHGGILEDIQIIGMEDIIDPLTSLTTGKTLTLNGIFRFNIGNEITIMDKDLNTYKTKVRLPVEEDVNSFTTKVETIPDVGITIPMPFEKDKYKVVSEFNNTNWKSGIWTNGVFNSGLWEGGMFYDGIFNGVSI